MANVIHNTLEGFSFDQDFKDLWLEIKKKYNNRLFEIDGVDEKQIDFAENTKRYMTNKAISVDPNANVSEKGVIHYLNEAQKPLLRLNSYYNLYKWAKKIYDTNIARRLIEENLSGDIYINDFHLFSVTSYCFGISALDYATKGLFFLKKPHSAPAKHFQSFIDATIQTITYVSNSIAGAVAISDFLVLSYYYIKKDKETIFKDIKDFESNNWYKWYLKQLFQTFIYTINTPLRGGIQSPYTNVSVLDRPFLKSMFLDQQYTFPNGKIFSEEDIEGVINVQEIFLEVLQEELEKQALTFPVVTACLTVGKENDINTNSLSLSLMKGNDIPNNKILDEDSLKTFVKYNKLAHLNFYVGAPSALSSCCFSGDQKCLTRSSNGVNYMPFKKLFESDYIATKRNLTVFHNGSWQKGKIIKLPKRQKMYKVTTANKKTFILTDNHINVTLNGEKLTEDLTTDDYLMFNTLPLNGVYSKDENLSYEDGFIIGSFIGNGSFGSEQKNIIYDINFSMNKNNYEKIMNCIKNTNITKSIPKLSKIYNNVYPVRVSSKELVAFIQKWTNWKKGTKANTKELNLNVLEQSIEFRKGILDGWYDSDGGNSNRCYTTSKKLAEQMEVLITSLGMNSVIDISDKTNEDVIIREKTYKRNYPLYCVRWYSRNNKSKMKDIYIIKNNSIYFKIDSIEKVEYDQDSVYCFEMEDEKNPYFTLPNGLITHNCRLKNDYNLLKTAEDTNNNENDELSEMETGYFNSFGASNNLKIGSHRVVAINLPRIAYNSKIGNVSMETIKKRFYEYLDNILNDVYMILNIHRKILIERINSGLLPLYTYKILDLKRQFSTVGIVGLAEAIEIALNKDITTDEGLQFAKDILDFINNRNKEMTKKYHHAHNLEQIPAETAAVKLATKDRIYSKGALDYKLYSNQVIPLTSTDIIAERIRVQSELDSKFTGGAILHLNSSSKLSDSQQFELVKLSAEKGISYFAINYVLAECENGHFFVSDNHDKVCPNCGANIKEYYTRVVGFLTPVKEAWNEVRRDFEFENRKFYKKDEWNLK